MSSDPLTKVLNGFTGEQFIVTTKVQEYFLKCCNELNLSNDESLEVMCTLHETFHLAMDVRKNNGC